MQQLKEQFTNKNHAAVGLSNKKCPRSTEAFQQTIYSINYSTLKALLTSAILRQQLVLLV